MRRRAEIALLLGAMVALSGCSVHSYAPGPGMSANNYGSEAANCRLFARGAAGSYGFAVAGSAKFVAASAATALAAGAVTESIKQANNYDDCMQARGWVIADDRKPAAPDAGRTLAPVAVAPVAVPSGPVVSSAAIAATTVVTVPRRPLGVRVQPVAEMLGYAAVLSPPHGLVVTGVMAGGAAAVAGVVPGDVILGFADRPFMTPTDLQAAMASVPAQSVVAANVWRDKVESIVLIQF